LSLLLLLQLRCAFGVFLLGRLGESLAKRAELDDLIGAELMVALGHIRHRLVEPGLLIFLLGARNAAPHDMLKELVSSLIKNRLRNRGSSGADVLLGCHLDCVWVE
jgi:hypothetical protein